MARPPKADVDNAIRKARQHMQRREFSKAITVLQTLQNRFGPAPIVYNLQAQSYAGMGQLDTAISCFRKSLGLMPKQPDALNNMGLMLFDTGQYDEALSTMESAVASTDKPGRYAASAARLFFLVERFDKAEHYTEIALREDPQNVHALTVRGHLSDWNADADTARAAYQAVLLQQPTNADVHFALSSLIDYTPDHPHIEQMRTILRSTRFPPNDEGQLRFGLGNALEKAGLYREACEEFLHANRLRRSTMQFDIETERARFKRIAADLPGPGDTVPGSIPPLTSARPLFIVGLPRSGTTLTEQILGGHSRVDPRGELGAMLRAVNETPRPRERPLTDWLAEIRQYYLSQARPNIDVDWFTDKRPINFRNVGYILSAMPEAKVIHMRRHPFHTCWSIFKRPFNGDGSEFTADLDELVAYYEIYDQLMEVWAQRFPDRFMTVVYESLVSDPETQIARMLEFAGLEHEDGLLDFHKSGRLAGSASRYQVQQPIFKNSADKSENFRPYVSDFASAMDAMALDSNQIS